MPAALVVLAAGSGSRLGAGRNKCLLPLGAITVLGWSLRRALAVPDVARVVVVVAEGEQDEVAQAVAPVLEQQGEEREVLLVVGGATRHDSEWAALRVLADDVRRGEVDVVAIHDAARPLAPVTLWNEVVAVAREHGGAIPGVAVTGLLARSRPLVGSSVDAPTPTALHAAVAVQTPQAFRAGPLLAAYEAAEHDGFRATDTAGTLARHAHRGSGFVVRAVPGRATNLKITFAEDVPTALVLLAADPGPSGS